MTSLVIGDLDFSEANTIRHTLWNQKYWDLYGLTDRSCGFCKWSMHCCGCDKTVYKSQYKNISNDEIDMYLKQDHVKKFYLKNAQDRLKKYLKTKDEIEKSLVELNKTIVTEQATIGKITFN